MAAQKKDNYLTNKMGTIKPKKNQNHAKNEDDLRNNKHKICAQVRKIAQNKDLLSISQIQFQFKIFQHDFEKIANKYYELNKNGIEFL